MALHTIRYYEAWPGLKIPLSDEEIVRYSRQLILSEVGGKGQVRLRDARVLLVGAGGLGSPAALYLAAAGVGTVGMLDADAVDASNLQRQILHRTADIGRPKTASAAESLKALNPLIQIVAHQERLTAANAAALIDRYDVVVEGSDNFPTKFLVNDACVLAGKPFVIAGILQFIGQILTVLPGKSACYRCLFPEPPAPGAVPSCQEAGVLGAVAGTIGTLQATEVIKYLLGVGDTLAGRLLIYDALAMEFREVTVERDAHCPVCGSQPTIRTLADYEEDMCAHGYGKPGCGGTHG